jgi:hypothetical protein
MPWERRHYGLQWVEPLPRIPEIITNSIVYLYRDRLDAEGGVEFGASGFLLQMPSETTQQASHLYAVTNKHVVEGSDGSPVVRANLKHPSSGLERTYCFEFTESDWVKHPDHDLAVCALPASFDVSILDFSVINTNFLVTEQEFREKDIGPGDDVVYVGRFAKHAGKFENIPSVRFGNISMNPNNREPIAYSTGSGPMKSQVGFLVEARSRSGYSGSPVFFLHQHAVSNPRLVYPPFDMRLLGIDWGHLPEQVLLGDPQGYLHGSKYYVEVHAGMMGVVPAWYLLDFLNTAPRLIDQRQRDDVYYATHPAIGVPDGNTGEALGPLKGESV